MIGVDPKYMFCNGRPLCVFKSMIAENLSLMGSKVDDPCVLLMANMSEGKISPMTRESLHNIAGNLKNLTQRLSISIKRPENINDAANAIRETNEALKLLLG
jgi:hypothetical protein